MDPKHSMANTALAILETQGDQVARADDERKEKAVINLETAIKSDRNNPLTLKLIADHYFNQKNYQMSQVVCEHAFKVLDTYRRPEQTLRENPNFRMDIEFIRSDIFFILGKIHHACRNFKDAFENYLQAVKSNDQNMPAQFNLAKVFYYNDSYPQAEEALEKVLKNPRHKDTVEVIRLLAQTKTRLGKVGEGVELFKRVIELNPKDYEANIEIGQVFDQTDPKAAIIYYENALKILNSTNELVPPELLVNVGTLRLEIGKVQESMQAYEQAIANCDKLLEFHIQGEEHTKLVAIRLTARFNLAYWLETNNEITKATESYKNILREEPTYLDAYLRLAFISYKKGNNQRAFTLLEDAKKNVVTQRPVYQYCIKGKMLFDVCQTEKAVKEFKDLEQIIKSFDSYIVLSVANIYYEWSTRIRD